MQHTEQHIMLQHATYRTTYYVATCNIPKTENNNVIKAIMQKSYSSTFHIKQENVVWRL